MADKIMIVGEHILEKFRNEGVKFGCYNYNYYY